MPNPQAAAAIHASRHAPAGPDALPGYELAGAAAAVAAVVTAKTLADVAAVATASGALVAGRHNPVDATAGNLTMTLADASSAGRLTVVEKTDSTANTVTVSGNIRGSAGTVTLVWAHEAIEMLSKADGSWWPIAGHKTKASLDAAYAPGSGAFHSGDMFLGLAVALKAAPFSSFGVQAIGDSTTTPDSAWFRLLANQVAAAFPTLTHHYRKWNDTTQDHDRPIVISTGAAGQRATVMASGGSRVGMLYDGGLNVATDLDIRINLKSPTWASGATQALASKWTIDTSMSWTFYLTPTGALRINWSADGNFATGSGDRSSTAVVPFANNAAGWVRVVVDVDNGAAGNSTMFYTSTDGVTWTQLGTTLTSVGVTSIFPSLSRYSLGARGGSNSQTLAGTRFYEVEIRDGINGASLVPHLPDMWENTIGAFAFTYEGAPVLTWVMSGMPGAGLGYDSGTVGYLSDPVRMKKMGVGANFNQMAIFYSTGHNEYISVGNMWIGKLSTWIDTTSLSKNAATRIVLTQNPRTLDTGSDADLGHRFRRAETLAWSRRGVGIDVIDTYQAFLSDGRDMAVLIGDGIHPTGAGYQVWESYIMAELTAALNRVTG